MLDIKCPDYLAQVRQFAQAVGAADELEDKLDYLATYGGTPDFTRCELHTDFAKNSFEFVIYKDDLRWFNGGLIYSGPGQPLDGSFPALTVGIGIDSSKHGWSIHT